MGRNKLHTDVPVPTGIYPPNITLPWNANKFVRELLDTEFDVAFIEVPLLPRCSVELPFRRTECLQENLLGLKLLKYMITLACTNALMCVLSKQSSYSLTLKTHKGTLHTN